MTQTVANQVAGETLRQVAERVVLDARNNRQIKEINAFVKADYQRLADAIEVELRGLQERCAKIAEQYEGHGEWCSSAAGDCQSLTVKAIAATIREGR